MLSGCKDKDVENSTALEPEATEITIEETAAPEPTPGYEMPQLPDVDFEGMSFFEDGYEIVEYRSLSDGDTATFVIGGMPMACRFLAIDTPEMNSSTYGMEPWAMAAKEFTKE